MTPEPREGPMCAPLTRTSSPMNPPSAHRLSPRLMAQKASSTVHKRAPYPARFLDRDAGRFVHHVHGVICPDPQANHRMERVHDRGLWASFKAWNQEFPSLERRPSSGDRVMRVHEYYLLTTLKRGATTLVHERAPYPLRSLDREAGRLVHNVHRVSCPDPEAWKQEFRRP